MKFKLFLVAIVTLGFQIDAFAEWIQFRGASGQSASQTQENLPTEWDTQNNTNVAWRADLPGRGPSGPIVVDGRVIVCSSSGHDQSRLHVLCFDEASGDLRWHRQFWATGRTMTHPSSANAAPTPTTDGEAIYAFFSSNDLICLDVDGNLRWFRGLAYDFPKAGNDIGMASSPVVGDNTVVVQVENQGDSFVTAVDAETGETRWQTSRPQSANWSSPLITKNAAGKSLVLLKSGEGLDAYDLQSGVRRWSYQADASGIPSVAARPGEVLLPADGLTVLEIPSDGVTPQVRWSSNRLNPGPASPIVGNDEVYALNRAGVLTCASLEDGKVKWQLRLGGTFWATPVLAGDHIFCINDAGTAYVVKIGEKGEILAKNEIGQGVQGSPAVSGDGLFVRTDVALWKFSSAN